MRVAGIARSLEAFVVRLNRAVHGVGLAVLLLLMLVTVADVIGRYVFDHPIPGTFELTGLMLAMIVFFALGHTQIHRGHVRISMIASFLSPKKGIILDGVIHLVSFSLFSLVAWQLTEHAHRLWAANNVSGVLSWPVYPFVIAAALGCSLFSLVLLVQFVHALAKLVRHEP